MLSEEKPGIPIIIGPTASGKTRLAVHLAKEINGEVISADSRQVFRGMDIGTGKDLSEYGPVPYHLIDIRDPGERFSVSDFQVEALRAIQDVFQRNKTPIICGGTMYYVKALIEDYEFGQPETDLSYTEKLESLDREKLYGIIKEKGLWRKHHWEKDSRRRMARAIEKATPINPVTPRAPRDFDFQSTFQYRIFYTQIDRETLRSRIRKRLISRMEEGLIEEVMGFRKRLSDEQLIRYGLEYRWVTLHLQGKLAVSELTDRLATEIARFAKRQMTFIRYLEKRGHEPRPVANYLELKDGLADWYDLS